MDEKLLELDHADPAEVLRLVAEERPFVMRGLCRDWPALGKWDFAYLTQKLKETPGKVYKGTFRSHEGALAEDIPTKEAVRRVLYLPDNFQIAENMAIWLSSATNVTTMHYDGYSYDGFNVQVQGHKTFELCHPDLECVMAPFLQGALPDSRDAAWRAKVTNYRVDMAPGDCLFTPRFWYHTVAARSDATNVQYHFARKTPPAVETRAMRHYANNAWVVQNAPYLIPKAIRAGISERTDIIALYAGMARRNEALAQAGAAMLRMAQQVVGSPLRTSRYIRQYNKKTIEDLPKLA